MNYIEDIETYLFIIDKHKEQIFKKYTELRTKPFEMDSRLKLVKYKKNKKDNQDKNQNDENQSYDEDDDHRVEKAGNIENECHVIERLIESIINFSQKEKILVIYMRSTFWINLIEQYDYPDWENISNCHKLREVYKKYNEVVNTLYEENDIKYDINKFYDRDQFAHMLNKLISKFLEKNQQRLTNAEKLGVVQKFNPFFNIIDERDKNKFKNKRETYIFDYVNFSKITPAFIEAFHIFNFETIFKENITEYINKITEKIKDIQTFGNIIKLVDETRMKEEDKKDYFHLLKEKYNSVIKYNINSIKDDKELKNAIKILAEFVSKRFLFYGKNDFLENEIELLEDNIKSLIYLELITEYFQDEYNIQKEFIYEQYLKKIKTKEGRDNVIKLVKNLKDKDQNKFIYEKLLKVCIFTDEEFFSNHENYKIQQLCLLNEELNKDEKMKKLDIIEQALHGNKNAKSIETELDKVTKKLEEGKITKRDMERFLNITKKEKNMTNKDKKENDPKNVSIPENNKNDIYVKQKLGLIAIILKNEYNAGDKYDAYKKNIDEINKKVDELTSIQDSLMIFHRNTYINDIKYISKILEDIENSPICDVNNNMTKFSDDLMKKHNGLHNQIKDVKDFLLFKKIYDEARGKDQEARFNEAYEKLNDLKTTFKDNPKNIEVIFNNEKFKNIFKLIKDELGKKDEKNSEEFLNQMKINFNITDENAVKDLQMLIKSKKYEIIVKSIDYFFKNFLGKDLNLSEKMKTLSDLPLEELKIALKELKKKEYYDYESNSPYYRIFTSIYEKKEAIDFLLQKISKEAKTSKNFKDLNDKLQKNLDPTNRSIAIKDIRDTIDCLKHVNCLLYKYKDIPGIIKYIKELKEKDIIKFENFSKKFASIIALDNKTGEDSFKEVYDFIQKANILFHLDSEEVNGGNEKIKNVDELIKFGNKINIESQNEKNEKEEEDDIFKLKCKKLIFFKEEASKIEIIYDKINKLRAKGYNVPIEIEIEIKYNEKSKEKKDSNVIYKLYGKEKDFNYIKDYLFKIQNDYEMQLSQIYENEKYLRFLKGKYFRKVRQHQNGDCEISDIIRFILNKTKLNKEQNEIKDTTKKYINTIGEDYETDYSFYTKDIFKSIASYISELFEINELDLNKHYENMIIKQECKKRGISILECKKEQSMEENILSLFATKLNKLPIAQNILICSRETTIEELQSFLYRAILCEYNTLFVLEILGSFSNFQLNKMYSYIDRLTSIKMEKYKKKKDKKKKIDKSDSSDYLDSYIVFIYKNLSDESAFKNELNNYIKKDKKEEEDIQPNYIDEGKKMGDLDISNISSQSIRSIQNDDIDDIINNITVISSDVCGLGKSFKIKKLIEEEKKRIIIFL